MLQFEGTPLLQDIKTEGKRKDTKRIRGEMLSSDICVVGAGAAGITAALELARSGIKLLLVEAGGTKWRARCQDSYKGILNPDIHAPLDAYRHHRLGGTTTVWGGRCVPYDNIDFEYRNYVLDSS